jgi:DNA repair photolyase
VITVGSVSRDRAAESFEFLAPRFRGRRNAIKELTHAQPDFVFWIYPDGRLHDARDAHARNVPRGYEHILDDEPDYGGFLRGRI